MYNIWLRDMLRNLRVKLENTTIIHQDNNAAITMIDSNSVKKTFFGETNIGSCEEIISEKRWTIKSVN